MARNFRFEMDQKDIVKSLITTVGSFIQDRLLDKDQRTKHKELCAERLAAEDGISGRDSEVRYSDQAVLANLDWGIDALEEAISTSNMEAKMARLDYAEKMLQVCAMLNSSQRTAGVPNFYLSAWAHLNLSYLWKMRNNTHNAVLHVFEMFIVDPFFSRIDFAPELWRSLFLPHMSSIVGWYSEERHRIVMDVIPDPGELSFTVDFDQYFDESLIASVRPDQAEKIEELEQLYGQSLDENTRLYVKYYKDCMNCESTSNKKVIPMLPIAEPPMTPLHEVSRAIPDYVKFGPILPKSAGFSPVLKCKKNAGEASRTTTISASPGNLEDSAVWDIQKGVREEIGDDDSDYEGDDTDVKDEQQSTVSSYNSIRSVQGAENGSIRSTEVRSRIPTPTSFSPTGSPKALTSNLSSPRSDVRSKKESKSLLRLLSSRAIGHGISTSPHSQQDLSISSEESDLEVTEQHEPARRSSSHRGSASPATERSFHDEKDEGIHSCISSPFSDQLAPQSRPPKDFVCPITSQIFYDPVTLETGQTYERKAIQEWVNRGNTTCPITRQPLSSTALPKTNYVLKRLITSWKELHPDSQELSYANSPRSCASTPSSKELCLESNPARSSNLLTQRSVSNDAVNKMRRFTRALLSTSPTNVISQAAIEAIINELRPYVSCLCDSEDLQECEAAVLAISKVWRSSRLEPGIHSYLSSPTIVNGFVEIMSASSDWEVLRNTIGILSDLIEVNDRVGEVLTRVDSDFHRLVALLRNGLAEAAVLIYLLRSSFSQLFVQNLIPPLTQILSSKTECCDNIQLVMMPKDAAMALLEQIIVEGDETSRCLKAMSFISADGIPSLLKCLDQVDGRQSILSILLCCIYADRKCRSFIADRIELSPVLELFHGGDDSARAICIEFLYELVQLNRRTICNQILQIIKEEGAFNTMHSLLVYLQTASAEQKPAIAALLLQLDLLDEPRKMSIYREEAIDALVEVLSRKDFSSSRILAFEALSALTGHLTVSGKFCVEAWLLKVAGFDQPYNALENEERLRTCETEAKVSVDDEEKAKSSWGKRIAFVLCNHEKGIIFKAIERCLRSKSIEMAKYCLVISTWLVHMLYSFPDTGIREVARKSLLDQIINILQSTKNMEEKILAALALRDFIRDSGPLHELEMYAPCIYKTLRKLKRHAVVVNHILKALMNLPSINVAELWCCTDGAELDSSMNGEVLCMLHIKGQLISSHSDGTIKVWETGKRSHRLIQEVREHTKAVTCLYFPSSSDKLYSGSLDKTIRVWVIKQDEIHLVQVHDVKEAVLELAANSSVACFSSQGTGVKVYNWSGVPKHVNFNKNVRCLALSGDKLYCGCSGYSIQEVDLRNHTSTSFYSGTRKLLGKQSVYALYIHNRTLISGGSSVDGIAGRVFSLSSKAVVGSLSAGSDIQRITANNDFIFAATKCGDIEVWLKEKATRTATIKTGASANTKITSLTSDADGEMLFAGFSDGKIQSWILD